ncbi:UNVERIFIED_CONTAM: cnp1 [Trichonephila clavipes]
MTPVELRWQKQALEALQKCTEFYLMSLLQKAQLCAFHIGRATIMKRDLQLARRGAGRLRGRLELQIQQRWHHFWRLSDPFGDLYENEKNYKYNHVGISFGDLCQNLKRI